jgi:hypothetical protein
MSRILRVSEGDYRVQVQTGGNITLDTGTATGKVIVTGDLEVQGNTTTINTANLTIEDNIIVLNKGESPTHAGITEGTAGIDVSRGSRPVAKLVFDESLQWYDPITSSQVTGTWVFRTGGARYDLDGLPTGTVDPIKTAGIRVASIGNDGLSDLVFDLQNSTKVLSIANSTNYEARVVLNNHIPNRKYVHDYVSATNGVADVDTIYKEDIYGTEMARVRTVSSSGSGSVTVSIEETLLCTFASSGLTFQNNININNNTITNFSVNNLKLSAQGSGIVEVDAFLQLDDRSVITTPDPLAVALPGDYNGPVLFSSTVRGAGKTGMYFVRERLTDDGVATEEVKDELVAKNRALLFSMIF